MKQKREIVRIKEIYKIENFNIFCHFTNGEYRFVDFEKLLKHWNVEQKDPEYKLLNQSELHKVKIVNGTMSWSNIAVFLLDENGKEKSFPFELDPIILFENSQIDEDKVFENFGMLIRNERLKAGLTTKQLAKKSGIAEEYISKIENETSNLELLIIRDILQNGFGKRLKINIE
jgi:DNA-binding XRE family transcriptional regulator